jgi:hypothetical protein
VATQVLEGGAPEVRAGVVRTGLRPLLGKMVDLRQVDGALDLSWHTDQLHRLGAGREPDAGRSWGRALVAMGLRNGPSAFRAKRG